MKSLPAEFLAWGPWLVLCRSRLLQELLGGGGRSWWCGQQHLMPGRGGRKLPMAATTGGPTSLSRSPTPTILDPRRRNMWYHVVLITMLPVPKAQINQNGLLPETAGHHEGPLPTSAFRPLPPTLCPNLEIHCRNAVDGSSYPSTDL